MVLVIKSLVLKKKKMKLKIFSTGGAILAKQVAHRHLFHEIDYAIATCKQFDYQLCVFRSRYIFKLE